MTALQHNLPFIVIVSIWIVLSVFGNVCVLLVILRNKRMHTVTNLFICNLAVSDICLAAIILPQNVHDLSHTDDYHEGKLACKLVTFLPLLCITVSIYSLVAMSFERLKAIVYHHRSQVTLPMAKLCCLLIWLGGFIVSIPTIVEYSVYEKEEEQQQGEGTTEMLSSTHVENHHHLIRQCGNEGVSQGLSIFNGFFLLCVSYVIPMIAMVVNYGCIVNFILKNTKQVNPADNKHLKVPQECGTDTRQVRSKVLSKKRTKIVKMLIIVALLFCLCWLPYFIILIMAKITGKDDTSESDSVLNKFRLTLTIFSTSYNVVLYLLYNTDFRICFKNLLCGCMLKNRVMPASPGHSMNSAGPSSAVPSVTAMVDANAHQSPPKPKSVGDYATSN